MIIIKEDTPLPCPFCGNTPEVLGQDSHFYYLVRIYCKECGATGKNHHFRSGAINHWNTRASNKPTDGIPVCRSADESPNREMSGSPESTYSPGNPPIAEANGGNAGDSANNEGKGGKA